MIHLRGVLPCAAFKLTAPHTCVLSDIIFKKLCWLICQKVSTCVCSLGGENAYLQVLNDQLRKKDIMRSNEKDSQSVLANFHSHVVGHLQVV